MPTEIKREPRKAAAAMTFQNEAFICNITEETFAHSFDFGEIRIEGCEPGQEYRVTRIEWRNSRVNVGDKSDLTEISALDIAKDLVRMANGEIGEHSYAGIFLMKGEEPTKQELREAHAKLKTRYEWAVNRARKEWERTHRTDWITDEERRAARYLNIINEPWVAVAVAQELCPVCGISHNPGIAKCGHCGAILDVEKARQFGVLPPGFGEEKETRKSKD